MGKQPLKQNSLKPNAASHNTTSWHTDSDGFLVGEPVLQKYYWPFHMLKLPRYLCPEHQSHTHIQRHHSSTWGSIDFSISHMSKTKLLLFSPNPAPPTAFPISFDGDWLGSGDSSQKACLNPHGLPSKVSAGSSFQ